MELRACRAQAGREEGRLIFPLPRLSSAAEPGSSGDAHGEIREFWGVLGTCTEIRGRYGDGDTGTDRAPVKNHVYSIDGPGRIFSPPFHDQVIIQLNFMEFVRVRFDGVRPSGNQVDGSCCSLKAPWHAFGWLLRDGDAAYKLRADKCNEVEQGYKSITVGPDVE